MIGAKWLIGHDRPHDRRQLPDGTWAELVTCPTGHPTGQQTSKLARRVAGELSEAGWRLERVLCLGGGEFKSQVFGARVQRLGVRRTHIHAGRPQTNGNVEALQRTILD